MEFKSENDAKNYSLRITTRYFTIEEVNREIDDYIKIYQER